MKILFYLLILFGSFAHVAEAETIPTCKNSSSDPDGDGWGWENNQSCKVSKMPSPASASVDGIAVCKTAASDPDGDGWGWENNQSCKVSKVPSPAPATVDGVAICKAAASDPDGDGWGWENNKSCKVSKQPSPAPVVDSTTKPIICKDNQWYASPFHRCFEKKAACNQYNGTDQKTCESDKDAIHCDWDNNKKSCFEEPGASAPASTNLRALVDNADETIASIKLFEAKHAENAVYTWLLYSGGVLKQFLYTNSNSIDLTTLGQYAGYELGGFVTVDGKDIYTLNKIEIGEPVRGPLYTETVEAEKEGLGLLGTPIVRRINFSFETYQLGCKKKTVVSIKGIYTEEECDYRNHPKEFTQTELETLKAAAITAFKTLMLQGVDATTGLAGNTITQCAVRLANASHGDFDRGPDVASLLYTSDNAGQILDNQLAKWSIFNKTEDFNIHFRLNWASKPEYVIGHSNVGKVLPNFEHVKIHNTDKNRFEINMSRLFLPPDRNTDGVTTYHDDQGVARSYPVSLLMSAGTIAHEMMHQMGIRHTINPVTKSDYQDDFVYSVGDCVEANFISNYEWNDTVAF